MKKKVLLLLLAVLCLPLHAMAYSPNQTYTYNIYGEPLALRDAYQVDNIVDGTKLGITSFNNINSLYVKDNQLFICDSGNNRIVVMNASLKLERVIEGFVRDGKQEKFNFPTDIATASNGDLYIVDSRNNRIVVLSKDGKFIRLIDHVTSEMLGANYQFTPTKIVLNSTDNIFVVAKGVNFGIMHIDLNGDVKSFLGAAKVGFDLMLYLKKQILTKEQAKQLSRIVPTEYNNIFVDKNNFVYGTINVVDPLVLYNSINSRLLTVGGVQVNNLNESISAKLLRWISPSASQSGQDDVVKKLNLKGDDILRRSGYYPVVGDLDFKVKAATRDAKAGPSSFVDIVVDENGIFSVLDQSRNRIFTYDDNGVLLYAFGGTGRNEGLFDKVSSIERLGDSLLVADSLRNVVVAYRPTEFAQSIEQGIKAYRDGLYEKSVESWKKSLSLSSNFEIGYIGVGRALLRLGEYKEAMHYFKIGEYREGYNQAYEHYRESILRNVIGYAIVALVLLSFLRFLWRRQRKSRLQMIKNNAG
ncbi:hypothetical protein [Paenibacillus sp. BC26]|uniref:hypothetical protein n=1 Tax=Paenibacillus sp. BC26 TaxID=1881032 RepID=UPI0008E8D8C4|nr:hypothetical protein [Paenibacillus sp. BC26]SFS74087.1 NHL repeat-containing protein [Paenibacillus sp. BC26]